MRWILRGVWKNLEIPIRRDGSGIGRDGVSALAAQARCPAVATRVASTVGIEAPAAPCRSGASRDRDTAYMTSPGRPESRLPPLPQEAAAPNQPASSPSQSRGTRNCANFASSLSASGWNPYSQRTNGGRLIRIDSVRPPDCRPNKVPRSNTRLNST